MARRLSAQEALQVWERLQRRLTAFDGQPEQQPRSVAVHQHDHGAFPGNFPDRVIVPTPFFPALPHPVLLSAIREALEQLGEPGLYFLAKEYAEGDEVNGLEWEIPLAELGGESLEAVSPGFECYLYSAVDAWAIYFHHEGFGYCGGCREFTDIIRSRCDTLELEEFEQLCE